MKFRQLFWATTLSILAVGGFSALAHATDARDNRVSLSRADIEVKDPMDNKETAEAKRKSEAFMEEYYGSKDGPLAEQYAKQEQLEASRKKVAAYNMTWQERKKQIEDEKLLMQQKLQEKEQAAKEDEKLVAPRQVYRPADRKQDNAPPRLFNNVR